MSKEFDRLRSEWVPETPEDNNTLNENIESVFDQIELRENKEKVAKAKALIAKLKKAGIKPRTIIKKMEDAGVSKSVILRVMEEEFGTVAIFHSAIVLGEVLVYDQKITPKTAKAVLGVFENLNSENQKKFIEHLDKNEKTFNELVNFALENITK
tara:strand:- start:1752 stop:2216 length:465 start_codon:yes stop_codon:yes gene_type:complete